MSQRSEREYLPATENDRAAAKKKGRRSRAEEFASLPNSSTDRVSARRPRSIPVRSRAIAMVAAGRPSCLRAFLSVLRRWEKAAFTSRMKKSSSRRETAGASRTSRVITAESTLGHRAESAGRDHELDPRHRVKLDQDGEITVLLASRRRGDPLGNLLLQHQRQAREPCPRAASSLWMIGRGYIIRKICDHLPSAGKRSEGVLERIGLHDLDIPGSP